MSDNEESFSGFSGIEIPKAKDLISAFKENEDMDDVINMIEMKEVKKKKLTKKKEAHAKKEEYRTKMKEAAAGWALQFSVCMCQGLRSEAKPSLCGHCQS